MHFFDCIKLGGGGGAGDRHHKHVFESDDGDFSVIIVMNSKINK